MIILATAAAFLAALAACRFLLITVTVEGLSMYPVLHPGDVLLVLRGRTARSGRIAVVERPDPAHGWSHGSGSASWYVKRVSAAPGDVVPEWAPVAPGRVPPGQLLVIGEHPRSEDSRRWGYCPAERLLGVVVVRLKKAA